MGNLKANFLKIWSRQKVLFDAICSLLDVFLKCWSTDIQKRLPYVLIVYMIRPWANLSFHTWEILYCNASACENILCRNIKIQLPDLNFHAALSPNIMQKYKCILSVHSIFSYTIRTTKKFLAQLTKISVLLSDSVLWTLRFLLTNEKYPRVSPVPVLLISPLLSLQDASATCGQCIWTFRNAVPPSSSDTDSTGHGIIKTT